MTSARQTSVLPVSGSKLPAMARVATETHADVGEPSLTASYIHQELSRFADIQARGIRYEFQRQEKRMHDQIEGQDERAHAQFEDVHARFDLLQATQVIIGARQSNQTAYRLTSRIYPVEMFDTTKQMLCKPPEDIFPRWVGSFWRLKQPRNWSKLVKLHEFYKTEGWERWGVQSFEDMDGEDAEQDEHQEVEEEDKVELVPGHTSLAEAIEYAPDIALSELARHLGLNYDEIGVRVTNALVSDISGRITEQRTKRASSAMLDLMQQGKRCKTLGTREADAQISSPTEGKQPLSPEDEGNDGNPPSPTEVNTPPGRLPLRDLIGNDVPTKVRESPRTISTKIGWKPPSTSSNS
ncbi:hypothetical protein BDY17DRAFT_306278 [Neohortaea acidophila]|uniref:Uncharacterized protein n=1 Tax=Neohortaea acidophila TaxID=245834 RepID=A0A6A6PEW0_9PEZI|nr:uncharacterized protein BDY17DRAFT_306278 [Neohortaea acidophila]KAF2478460.1 hypothetical protein BDY17DRAFT_306278 [Neohortaea acidophila]